MGLIMKMTALSALLLSTAFHAKAGCLEKPEDLLRYPMRLDLPAPEHRPAQPAIRDPWYDEDAFDLPAYAAALRSLMHAQGIGTTLTKPTEKRYTLILEGVGPGGNELARCYLEMADLLEVDRVVVHIMGPATRRDADNLEDAGEAHFTQYFTENPDGGDRRETGPAHGGRLRLALFRTLQRNRPPRISPRSP